MTEVSVYAHKLQRQNVTGKCNIQREGLCDQVHESPSPAKDTKKAQNGITLQEKKNPLAPNKIAT